MKFFAIIKVAFDLTNEQVQTIMTCASEAIRPSVKSLSDEYSFLWFASEMAKDQRSDNCTVTVTINDIELMLAAIANTGRLDIRQKLLTIQSEAIERHNTVNGLLAKC